MEYLLAIGLAMLAGLLLTRLTKRFNLPDVTSYLIAGLLVGPLVLGAFGVPGLGFGSFEFGQSGRQCLPYLMSGCGRQQLY